MATSQSNWSDTKFYEPHEDGDLKKWLQLNKPSETLGCNSIEWLAVVHPSLNSSYYKQRYNRSGQTPEDIVEYVKRNKGKLSHKDLVKTALEYDVLKGYWVIFSEDDEQWDRDWEGLVTKCWECESSFDFLRIETSMSRNTDSRVIHVIVDDITDLNNVKLAAKICASAIELSGRSMYFKPSFYTDCGMYYDENSGLKSYIYKYENNEPDDFIMKQCAVDIDLHEGLFDLRFGYGKW